MDPSRPGSRRAPAAIRAAVLTGLTAGALLLSTAAPGSAAPAEGTVRLAAGTPVTGGYIVVLRDGTAADLAARYSAEVRYRYGSALHGFAGRMTARSARQLAALPQVAWVEQDSIVQLAATQPAAPWSLDRIDQHSRTLNTTYVYSTTAANVSAYVIDTGIRTTHRDFGTRARVAEDTVGDGQNGQDCNGHGTHVAGTIGGARFGVAKAARLYSVRVLDCSGSGTLSGVLAGVDWVKANAKKPAVANMSLGGPPSATVDRAVRSAIASGVTFTLAAGNESTSACDSSPSRLPAAITVGATDRTDVRPDFSNYGTCLDLFAPGVDIRSDWGSGDTATATISGTSMASPHVAGAAALYLASHPKASPGTVRNALVAAATAGAVKDRGAGSPNRLLYTRSL